MLSEKIYDDFFRVIGEYNFTTGLTNIGHGASPMSRETVETDAVGNVTTTIQTADTTHYSVDDIGRSEYVLENYKTSPAGSIRTTPTYSNAGLFYDQTIASFLTTPFASNTS